MLTGHSSCTWLPVILLFCLTYFFLLMFRFGSVKQQFESRPSSAHRFSFWQPSDQPQPFFFSFKPEQALRLHPILPFIALLSCLFYFFSPCSHSSQIFLSTVLSLSPGYNGADYRRQRGTAAQPRRDPGASSWTLPTRPTACSGRSSTERSSCKRTPVSDH